MRVDEYLEVLQTEKPTIIHNGILKHFPFPINPEDDCLGIEEIQRLRGIPYSIEEGEKFLKVNYPNGEIKYFSKDNVILPQSIIIYGELNQEISDTEIYFKQVEEEEIDTFKDFLIYDDTYLKIEIIKPERDAFYEWCMPENRR